MRQKITYWILFLLMIASSVVDGQSVLADRFNKKTMSFEGDAAEQAKYLLCPVMVQGRVGAKLTSLPDALQRTLSKQLPPPSIEKIRLYLNQAQIKNEEIGGNPDLPLCQNMNGITANYFVIHDTSTPVYPKEFPANINELSWKYNNFKLLTGSKAPVFVNRKGQSITQVNFNTPWRATKFESKLLGSISRGNFIHVELMQPRRSDPRYKQVDAVAPDPGFTPAQLKRLALLYIAASARKNDWLIPVYHAVLDDGIANGHDDPQYFKLDDWANQIQITIDEINSSKPTANLAPQNPVVPATGKLQSINCKGKTKIIGLAFRSKTDSSKTWARTVSLPLNGRFTIEAHYVTKTDTFINGYPATQNEKITDHLNRSLQHYKQFDSTATFQTLYKYNKLWTPMESGKFGQGSTGDRQNKLLDAPSELWMMNMMWAANNRPPLNTKFLLTYNGRNVVVIAGYETGPREQKFLGGVTGEVHSWLKSGMNSQIKLTFLEDQSAPVGPCGCQ